MTEDVIKKIICNYGAAAKLQGLALVAQGGGLSAQQISTALDLDAIVELVVDKLLQEEDITQVSAVLKRTLAELS